MLLRIPIYDSWSKGHKVIVQCTRCYKDDIVFVVDPAEFRALPPERWTAEEQKKIEAFRWAVETWLNEAIDVVRNSHVVLNMVKELQAMGIEPDLVASIGFMFERRGASFITQAGELMPEAFTDHDLNFMEELRISLEGEPPEKDPPPASERPDEPDAEEPPKK
jgi:hypothetical protein